jgi:hypothetical protein
VSIPDPAVNSVLNLKKKSALSKHLFSVFGFAKIVSTVLIFYRQDGSLSGQKKNKRSSPDPAVNSVCLRKISSEQASVQSF